MRAAYCTLEDVKSSLSGDVPNMGASHDQSLVNKILEVSKDLDRQVARCRGDSDELFSFLADRQYGQQRVYMSSSPAPTSGSFVLSFGGEITNPIAFDATGADVQVYLSALSTVGDGNVTVTGLQGGPWVVDFAGSLSGPQAVISGRASTDVADATIVVLPMYEGVALVPSERFFYPTPDVWGNIILIDDCVEISSVMTYDASGSSASSLSSPGDYRPYPLRGLPIQGIKSTGATWPAYPAVVGVTATWGHRWEVPADVREGAVIEAVRSHFAAVAGNDDRLGMTPFGKVITSKAFTSKFKELVADYGHSKLYY